MNEKDYMLILAAIRTKEPKHEDGPFLIVRNNGKIDKNELYEWDDEEKEFYGNIIHHIPLSDLKGWISVKQIENDAQVWFNGQNC